MIRISHIHSQIKFRPCRYKFWSESSETRYLSIRLRDKFIKRAGGDQSLLFFIQKAARWSFSRGNARAKFVSQSGGKIRGKLSLNYEPLKRLRVSRFHPPVTWRFLPLFFSCSRTGHAFQFAGGKRGNEFPPRKRMAPR